LPRLAQETAHSLFLRAGCWRWVVIRRLLRLVAELADVDGVGRESHGVEVHGTTARVGAEDGAEETAAKMKTLDVGFERELDRLS
jgi:hypothetical protein